MGGAMSLVLSGDTSGTITVDVPAVAGTNTISLPALTGTLLTDKTAGTILQVVNAAYSTQTSTSSNVFADTGITATITPKFTTSKILVMVAITGVAKTTNNTYGYFQLLRSATVLAQIERVAAYNNSSSDLGIGTCGIDYLDSPATTSATTYKVQFSSRNNNAAVFICSTDGGASSTSTITLMEIAA
jgi:hypothetical protein